MSQSKKKNLITAFVYFFVAVFVFAARFIYYHFAHGLSARVMEMAFIPTLAFSLFYLVNAFFNQDIRPYSKASLALSALSFSLYMFIAGVYEMASLVIGPLTYLLILGFVFLAIGLLLAYVPLKNKKSKKIASTK